MRRFLSARTDWHARVDGIRPPAELRSWLTDTASLTAKLTARYGQFRVQVLRESSGRGLGGECAALRTARSEPVWQREVLLRCDRQACVFARTVLPLADLSAWPWLPGLGEQSLGAALFADPLIARGPMRFAALAEAHPLRNLMRCEHTLEYAAPELYARRSAFTRGRRQLLVSEIFLPSFFGNIET